ncbi:MAG: Hpt domain-containing protein, partial [Thiopseudomonas sp.]
MALDIKKFIHRFIDEAREQLRLLETGLEQLRHGEHNAELVNSLFRAAHTLKGSSRMLKLLPISDTAHSLEDVLSALRDQKISLSDATLDLMLEAVDALSNLTTHLASNPDPAALPERSSALCQRLAAAATGDSASDTPTTPEPAQPQTAAPAEPTARPASEPALRSADSVRLKLDNLEQLIKLMSEVTISQAGLRELLQDARTLYQAWESTSLKDARHSPLFAAYQQLYQGLRDVIGSQESLVQNLHEQSLGLRMLPLTQILEPARKLVRDMGRELGKPVELQVIGEEIELDRQLIEKQVEPVQHLLRNALDHGLESSEQRQAAGKNPRGLIQISARQDGGWVSLDISDDGAGLDVDKIRNKALRQNLFSEEELAQKSPAELKNLIFLPGFSTSVMITELSGRGVGLDVVKRSVEDLQG